VRIDEVEVIDSNLPARHLRLVLAWAELHQHELIENWRLARAGETLNDIESTSMTGLTPDITDATVVRHEEEIGTVVWRGGADLAPDTLYERVRTGMWPDQDVAA
jgi:Domain of unknown function (DUF4160)